MCTPLGRFVNFSWLKPKFTGAIHELIPRYLGLQVMEMALDHVAGKGARRPLHLSYDIDAVDPAVAPSTGTAVNGGLNYREAHYVAEALAETGMLGSMDLVRCRRHCIAVVSWSTSSAMRAGRDQPRSCARCGRHGDGHAWRGIGRLGSRQEHLASGDAT
jgi:hypothetical protein